MANSTKESVHPVQLWVGSRSALIDKTHAFCKNIWCTDNGQDNCSCHVCRAIDAHSFYGIHWLVPQKNGYTVDQVQEILHAVSFALEKNEQRIIVFEAAEQLSMHTAPRLLKPLEEPHPGYGFILLTESKDQVLDTIVSRCVVSYVNQEGVSPFESARTLLTKQPINLVAAYEYCQNLTEHETRSLVDELCTHWHQVECSAIEEQNNAAHKKARAMLSAITRMLSRLPLAGNVKYFWRTLLLHMSNV